MSETSDITDAHVAITALHCDHAIATCDAADLTVLAPTRGLIEI